MAPSWLKGSFDIEAVHDEVRVVFEHKMSDKALKKIGDAMHAEMQGYMAMQAGERHVGKIAAIAANYGKGAGTFSRVYMPPSNKTLRPKTSEAKQRISMHKLDHAERAWARAFYAVMNVKADFYANAPAPRRRFQEKHYTELAKEDSKRGERAQRVLAHIVADRLDDSEDLSPAEQHLQTMTGRTFSGPSYQNIPKSSKITGRSADFIIVDEITPWK